MQRGKMKFDVCVSAALRERDPELLFAKIKRTPRAVVFSERFHGFE